MDHTDRETFGRLELPPEHPDDDTDPLPDRLGSDPSLMADVDAFFTDAKTYLQAEAVYQKSRAGFAANRLKWSVLYGAAAFGLIHLALIALTVGVVIALTPLVGPWLATGIVVALLVLGAIALLLRLRTKVSDMRAVFDKGEP